MPKFFKRNCNNCGKYYEKYAKYFCGVVCAKEHRYKNRKYKDVNEIKKEWAKRNPEKTRETQKRINHLKWKEYQKRYEEKHPGRLQENKRKWFVKNYVPNPVTDLTMKAKSAIAKGKLLENFVANLLKESGADPHARRTFGSGNGHEKGDIYNGLGLNIECKNTNKIQLNRFWAQTVRDSQKTNTFPILIWHPPNQPLESSAVIMEIEYFAKLLAEQKENIEVTTKFGNEEKWKIQKLVQSAKDVIKMCENG